MIRTFASQIYSFPRRTFCSTSVNLGNENFNIKPFCEIPSISTFKMVKENLPGGKYYNKSIKEISQLFYKEFGDVVKIPALLGKPELVITFNAQNFEKVFRAEGIWPFRMGIESLTYYRETKRPEIYKDYGSLIISQGEKWAKMRSIANPIFMQPNSVKKYTHQVDEIAKEFVEIMSSIRNEKSEMPADFSNYIHTWLLESISIIGLERKLNLFDLNTHDENATKLIKGIRDVFELSAKYDRLGSVWKIYETKGFKELMNVYDTLTDAILYYIEAAQKEIDEVNSSRVDMQDCILRKLLRIDKRVAVIMISDLILFGVDTTGSSILSTLYCLAKNPDKQKILRQEILKIIPDKTSKLTPQNTTNMPYLRAVVNESMRLYPVVAANVRKITKDIVLSGYRVPANTHVGIEYLIDLKNEKYYPDPEKFHPERWLRDQGIGQCRHGVVNPFTFLPFGFGARSCIGKRISELQLEILIVNIVRNFRIEWHHPDMKVKNTFINIPDSEMKFKIIDV